MTDQELIIAAAEKVMGWKASPPDEFGNTIGYDGDTQRWLGQHWNPLGSDADAFMLVDELTAQGWYLKLGGPSPWGARFWHSTRPGMFDAVDHARRRAIVLAALHAKGVEC